jgi:hypothetical protein
MWRDGSVPNSDRAVGRVRRAKRKVHERYVLLDLGIETVVAGSESAPPNVAATVTQSSRSALNNSMMFGDPNEIALYSDSNGVEQEVDGRGYACESWTAFPLLHSSMDLCSSEAAQGTQAQMLPDSEIPDSESEAENICSI